MTGFGSFRFFLKVSATKTPEREIAARLALCKTRYWPPTLAPRRRVPLLQ